MSGTLIVTFRPQCIGHLRQAYQHPTMPLMVHEGQVREYLGMTFDFPSPEEVKISMRDYINSIIEEGPTSSRGHANTPAAINLFEINTNSPYLNKDAKDLFHHLVAKLLFLCKRVRPDIHTAVAFLTTKVKQPTEDDQSALDKVIKYLNKTRARFCPTSTRHTDYKMVYRCLIWSTPRLQKPNWCIYDYGSWMFLFFIKKAKS